MMIRAIGVFLVWFAAMHAGSTAVALPNHPPCPTGTSELYVTPFARGSKGVVACNTIFSCLNLDSAAATVTAQYFDGPSSTQAGSDVTLTIGSGSSVNLGALGTPVNFFHVHSHANAGFFDGKGRVCSSTDRLACQAFFVCSDTQASPPDGWVLTSLPLTRTTP